MGIGTWGPANGEEGFTVRLPDSDTFEYESIREDIMAYCEAAGFRANGVSNIDSETALLAENDHIQVGVRGWGDDMVVRIIPLIESFSETETLIAIHESESLPAIFNALQEQHMSDIKSFLVNSLVEGGADCRFRTSGYTSISYEKDADFDYSYDARVISDFKIPSYFNQIAQISSPSAGGADRHNLLQSIADEGCTPAIGVIPVLHEGNIYFAGLGAEQAMDAGGDHNCLTVNLLTIESNALIGQELIYCAHEAVEELGESSMPTVLNDKWREILDQRIIKPYLKSLEAIPYGGREPITPIILSDTEVAEHWGNSFNNLAFPESGEPTDLSNHEGLEFSDYDQLSSAGSVELEEDTTLVIIPARQAQVFDLELKAEASNPSL